MEIKHATVKRPGDKLFAEADWNARHSVKITSSVKAGVSGQELRIGNWEVVRYDTSHGWDVGEEWDNRSSMFTAKESGLYLVTASINLTPIGSETIKNFGIRVAGPLTGPNIVEHERTFSMVVMPRESFSLQISCICKLEKKDNIQVFAFADRPAIISENANENQLFIQKIF